jgi:hypothetical protein
VHTPLSFSITSPTLSEVPCPACSTQLLEEETQGPADSAVSNSGLHHGASSTQLVEGETQGPADSAVSNPGLHHGASSTQLVKYLLTVSCQIPTYIMGHAVYNFWRICGQYRVKFRPTSRGMQYTTCGGSAESVVSNSGLHYGAETKGSADNAFLKCPL